MAHTYIDLKIEVTEYMHRTDLDAKMDMFCELAESQLNKDLRTMEMEIRLPVIFDDTYYDLPTNYMELRAMHLEYAGARIPIQQYTPQQLDIAHSRSTGRPRAFAIHAGQIELRPGISNIGSPPVTYNGELSYYGRVDSIVTNNTNSVLENYPLIYLAAMLVQANTYVQDDSEMQKWLSIYGIQVDQANKMAEGGRHVTPTVRNS